MIDLDELRVDIENGTKGPWINHVGHSDWGLGCEHVIAREGVDQYAWDESVCQVPSVTPYCMGASRKDRDRASSQFANAKRIARLPELERAYFEAVEALRVIAEVDDDGFNSDGHERCAEWAYVALKKLGHVTD